MHDMREIPCPLCGRLTTVTGNEPVPCPSCGVPLSMPVAESPVADVATPAAPVASIAPASSVVAVDDDSATRVASVPPENAQSEPAAVDAAAAAAPPAPVMEPSAQLVAPISAESDTTDPRTQPVSEAVVQLASYPPAAPAAAPEPQQPITQTYLATPEQQPVTQTYAGSPVPQPAVRPAPKRNRALLIVGVVVAVVLLLGIIGAAVVFANRVGLISVAQPTPTPGATATATTPTGFSTFIDSNNVFKLTYPSSWTKQSTSGDFSLTIFSGTSESTPGVFEVEYFKTTIDPKTLQDQFFKGLSVSGKVVNKQGPTPTALAGESWQSETADVTNASSTQRVVVLTANHGQYSVVIAYLAAATAFENVNTHGFQPMLSSFQFLQ